MRLGLSACLPLAFLAACTATTQQSRTAAVATPPISEATLATLTQILSSDAFEGRAPTTPGEEKTVNLLAQRFQQAGLQPGNNGSWYQNVPLVETTATPTPLRITGGSRPLTFQYRTDMVANTYQVQPKVSLENSDIVFVGYGINAPRARLERLCGRRREGQDGHHPRQRSRLGDPKPRRPVRRQGDDLLRPLDLQI
jgi:hypothetical protein